MAGARAERRLAAILAADVVGYSALVEQDEAATLARLARLRCEVVEPQLAEHGGRLVKLIGDGLLAEFASVVDAAACAVAIQKRNDSGLSLRIGLNLGDVVVADEDLYGDGVNVAARLEGLAEAGGIVVSGTVRDQLHGQPGLGFASLGEPRLKNIARPVRAYRLTDAAGAAGADLAGPGLRPSIAVLPFDNLGGDPERSYFSDGLSEDLITALSRFRDMVVLARHSSFALRGEALGAVELGRRLGVRFLLEGSVRRAGQRVRLKDGVECRRSLVGDVAGDPGASPRGCLGRGQDVANLAQPAGHVHGGRPGELQPVGAGEVEPQSNRVHCPAARPRTSTWRRS